MEHELIPCPIGVEYVHGDRYVCLTLLTPSSLSRALDFLYMDYKPPHPLEVLIPDEVLSKYQRMFTFLLRLMRGEFVSEVLSFLR